MSNVYIMNHPLIRHKIGFVRRKDVEIETPICTTSVKILEGKKLAVIPILRAGLGMVEGILELIPAAKVGHIGLYRDPETLEPVEYYCKLPPDCDEREIFVVDPMLAPEGIKRMQETVYLAQNK